MVNFVRTNKNQTAHLTDILKIMVCPKCNKSDNVVRKPRINIVDEFDCFRCKIDFSLTQEEP